MHFFFLRFFFFVLSRKKSRSENKLSDTREKLFSHGVRSLACVLLSSMRSRSRVVKETLGGGGRESERERSRRTTTLTTTARCNRRLLSPLALLSPFPLSLASPSSDAILTRSSFLFLSSRQIQKTNNKTNNRTKEEKPTLAGVNIKTRKRNIAVALDPGAFADAVAGIFEVRTMTMSMAERRDGWRGEDAVATAQQQQSFFAFSNRSDRSSSAASFLFSQPPLSSTKKKK